MAESPRILKHELETGEVISVDVDKSLRFDYEAYDGWDKVEAGVDSHHTYLLDTEELVTVNIINDGEGVESVEWRVMLCREGESGFVADGLSIIDACTIAGGVMIDLKTEYTDN